MKKSRALVFIVDRVDDCHLKYPQNRLENIINVNQEKDQTIEMKQDTQYSSEDFWNFSVELYGTNKVKSCCLNLQDNLKIDVNLVLMFCWLAKSGFGPLEKPLMNKLVNLSQIWQKNILGPMRRVRRQIGDINEVEARNVYKSLLKSELEAEKAEQAVFVQALDGYLLEKTTLSPKRGFAKNIDQYLSFMEITPNSDEANEFMYIINQALEN